MKLGNERGRNIYWYIDVDTQCVKQIEKKSSSNIWGPTLFPRLSGSSIFSDPHHITTLRTIKP